MKRLLIATGTLSVLLAPCLYASTDFFSALWKEHEEHMQRVRQAFEHFEGDLRKSAEDSAQHAKVSLQNITYSVNKTEKSAELVFEGLAVDKVQSRLDRAKKKVEVTCEHADGQAKVSLSLKPYFQHLLLVGKIAQSAEAKAELKDEKEGAQKQVVRAAKKVGFAESLEQNVNFDEVRVHYNKDKKQLRINIPFVTEPNSTEEIQVVME